MDDYLGWGDVGHSSSSTYEPVTVKKKHSLENIVHFLGKDFSKMPKLKDKRYVVFILGDRTSNLLSRIEGVGIKPHITSEHKKTIKAPVEGSKKHLKKLSKRYKTLIQDLQYELVEHYLNEEESYL